MKLVQALPGSFRDPSGRVYQIDGRIFRTVTNHFAADFEAVESTGLIKKLARERKILPAERVDNGIVAAIGDGARYVLETPRLPFVSFPYEWPFSALKAAALLHLEVHLAALDQGVTLADASAYNVQFQGARPIFIDHLSFRRYREGEIWGGHRQFCEQFLNPLLLRAIFGISHNAWYRGSLEGIMTDDLRRLLKWRHLFSWNILVHVVLQSFFQRATEDRRVELKKKNLPACALPLPSFRRLLRNLHTWISKLDTSDTRKTTWQNYAKTHTYSSHETELKKRFIDDFVRTTKPKLLWDFGCNSGEYSKTALEAGADYVVGFDFDHGALEAAFTRAHRENLPFQTIFMDAANPSPSQGWMEQERQSLRARASADAIIVLAFLHHLAISRNVPLEQLLDWIVGLAPAGVIEFVPKDDSMVQSLLHLREDIFPNYTKEFFLARIADKAVIVKTDVISSSGRFLVWYERP